jgi:hypothetical protein
MAPLKGSEMRVVAKCELARSVRRSSCCRRQTKNTPGPRSWSARPAANLIPLGIQTHPARLVAESVLVGRESGPQLQSPRIAVNKERAQNLVAAWTGLHNAQGQRASDWFSGQLYSNLV